MPTPPSDHSSSQDPFSDLGAAAPSGGRHRPASRDPDRTLLAALLLVIGSALIVAAALTAFSLRGEILREGFLPRQGDFAMIQEEKRNLRLMLAGCAIASAVGGLIFRGGLRVYDSDAPAYGRKR